MDERDGSRCAGLIIRLAQERDIAELVKLERRVWFSTGVPLYLDAHFSTWLRINPCNFLVAEYRGEIVGYGCQQRVDFSWADVSRFVSHDQATDFGYTLNTHQNHGNSFYGVSTVSIRAGAGMGLEQAMYRLGRKLGLKYYLGFPRLAGFNQYMQKLGNNNIMGAISRELEGEIALWYAIKCVEMVGGKIWDRCPSAPLLSLPRPDKLDPVLNWHLRNKEFGLVGVASNYMPDLPSRNYAAFNVYEFPSF